MPGKLPPPPPKPRLSQDSFSDVPQADRESLFRTLVGVEERITTAIEQARAEYRAELAHVREDAAELASRVAKVESAVAGFNALAGKIDLLNTNVTAAIQQNALQDTRIEALAAGREAGGKAGRAQGVLVSLVVAVLVKLWETLQK